ncbi:MAG: SusC/RagA family TonB-linked outer membrane protein, partial [Bacteroidota bacterium]
DIARAKESNIVNSLTGKVAGVQVMGGQNMGGSSRITIRGVNTLNSENQPLFIVDGMPIDNSNYAGSNMAYGNGDRNAALTSSRDYGNAAQDINPDDVESITVLKGPNATALYGSRGANGVILITTKKGTAKEGFGVTFSTGLMLSQAYVFPDLQNEYGGGRSDFLIGPDGPEADLNMDESWGPALEGQMVKQWGGENNIGEIRPWIAHPDNYRDFFEIGTKFDNHIAINGNDGKNSYRIAYTRMDERGTVPNSKLARNTFNISLDRKLNDKFSANLSMNYINTQGYGRPSAGGSSGVIPYNMVIWTQRQLDLERLKDYKYPDGSQRTWRTGGFGNTVVQANNPYWLVNEDYSTDERNRVFYNAGFSYKIAESLSLNGRFGQDWYADRRQDRRAVGTRYTPYYLQDQIEFKETNADLILTYDKRFGEDISLVASLGTSMYNQKRQRNTQQTSGGLAVAGYYSIENSIDRPSIRDTWSEKEVQSVFATASIGYKDFVYFDVTGRNDWSSTLPADNNSYFYPSVGGSLVFSELVDVDLLSFGKIRLGWAKAGNSASPYALDQIFSAGTPVGSFPNFSNPVTLNNANLRPEITTSKEVGLDLNLFENRLGINLTLYSQQTIDQIFNINVSRTTGFANKWVNAGKVENKGVELQLLGDILRSDDGLNWNISVNYARNNNKVLELLPGVDSYFIANFYTSGTSAVYLESRVGEEASTIYATKIARNEDGRNIIIADGTNAGTYKVTDDVQKIGSVLPDFNLGISNSFSYKHITFSLLFDMQKGGVIFARDYQDALYAGNVAETTENNIREEGIVLDGVVNINPDPEGAPIWKENTTNIDARTYNILKRKTAGDHTVFDASYIKLREISFGYNLPSSVMDRMPLKTLSISLVGRNLAILHRNTPDMIDPESAGNSSLNLQGRSYGQLPAARNFGFKLTTNF